MKLAVKIILFVSISSSLSEIRLNICQQDDLEVYVNDVSKEEANLIVNRHNVYRQAIMDGTVRGQPRGINVKFMKWDAALARTAQEIANTCDFKHQVVVDPRWRYKVGQNLFRKEQIFRKSQRGNWTRAVEAWFNEHRLYRYGRINTDYEETGHYTQLVWDKSYLIGCGFASYDNDNEDSFYDVAELYVCHYGPPGNHFWWFPYKLWRKTASNSTKNGYHNDDD
ncbi:Cysteine-rich secretory protein family [Popillia japonica]|uniref:Cysteine-rich secretory protein family n=1 Tax=Popillia japonica TaxID=7064 RepID=A0AAW1IE62_POPJA